MWNELCCPLDSLWLLSLDKTSHTYLTNYDELKFNGVFLISFFFNYKLIFHAKLEYVTKVWVIYFKDLFAFILVKITFFLCLKNIWLSGVFCSVCHCVIWTLADHCLCNRCDYLCDCACQIICWALAMATCYLARLAQEYFHKYIIAKAGIFKKSSYCFEVVN